MTSIDRPADPGEQHRPLTVEELRRLAASPLIEIGGHTLSHPTLALAPAEEQRREIRGCREALQDAINAPVDAFAYPYGGLRQDYLPEAVDIVREAGFTSAFTTGESFATLDGDPFQIPRFVMLESVGDVELAHRLLHSWRASGEPA
jgi:peptidoglycan/xylan/chitin deacetylase (PgdA/CDA1 family)